ncbi:MAG TPA: alpha/beta fold hydrolase [Ktedonobacterales bacterium]
MLRQHHLRYFMLLAIACVVVAACSPINLNPTTKPTATAARAARFQSGKCPFTLSTTFVQGKNVFCGNLIVPEDRANARSPMIQVAVARFKTPSAHPASDPIIFLQGGPGGRIIEDVAGIIIGGKLGLTAQFGNHDVILVDQRGTGYSHPSLQCPEVVNLQYLTDQKLTAQQQTDMQNDGLKTCRAHLASQGVNPGAYTTLSDAADIHDLIQTLGFAQVDLYGVSYGTRLALEVMRAYPQHVRSVILDSTVPAQSRLITSIPASTARVFKALFDGCAADATCNAKYPQLGSVFYSLVTSLNAQPLTFTATDSNTNKDYTVLFTGDQLSSLLFTSFYATSAIPYLPAMIYQIKQGDTRLASVLFGALMFDTSVSIGMYFSVECAEDISFATPHDVDVAAQAYPPQIRADDLVSLQGEITGCHLWNVPQAPTSEQQPVASAIPTLVMEDAYDPITPPSNGILAAKTLSNSYQFLFPGLGHGAFLFNDCPTSIGLAFYANPTTKPDGSCIATMGEPQFQ